MSFRRGSPADLTHLIDDAIRVYPSLGSSIQQYMDGNNRIVEDALKAYAGFNTDILALESPTELYRQLGDIVAVQDGILRDTLESFRHADLMFEALSQLPIVNPPYMEPTDVHLARLVATTGALSESYGVLKDAYDPGDSVTSFLSELSRPSLSVSEHFTAITSLRLILSDLPTAEKVDSDATDNIDDRVVDSLGRHNPAWPALLHGARDALLSSNPDAVRQACVSLRELLKTIILSLAPDHFVRHVLGDFKGKVTRRQRLEALFTMSGSSQELIAFVQHDIEAVLALFDFLNEAIHSVMGTTMVEHDDLRYVVVRTELVIDQILSSRDTA